MITANHIIKNTFSIGQLVIGKVMNLQYILTISYVIHICIFSLLKSPVFVQYTKIVDIPHWHFLDNTRSLSLMPIFLKTIVL